MSFMFCTVNGCDCQLIIKENYDDDDHSHDITNIVGLPLAYNNGVIISHLYGMSVYLKLPIYIHMRISRGLLLQYIRKQ